MTLEEKVKAFEAKLHDTLTDAGYVVIGIYLMNDSFGNAKYRIETDKGHAEFLISFQSGNFMRVLDMPDGYGF